MSAILLMTSSQRRFTTVNNKKELKDVGSCLNCKHQGNCPYSNGDCSRAYYHKIYSNKIEKSVDKFELK